MKFLIMGPPGAGKGSQASKIMKDYNVVSISTGQMFRDAYNNNDPIGIKAMNFIKDGNLVSDEITNYIVKLRLDQFEEVDNFILDGYPRTVNQAIALDEMLDDYGTKLDAVINIVSSNDVLFERMEQRRVCKSCGATYHLTFKPSLVDGVCDSCNGELHQRQDDTHESVKRRLEIYESKTRPLINYYEERGILFNVNGMQDFAHVYKDIKEVIDDL